VPLRSGIVSVSAPAGGQGQAPAAAPKDEVSAPAAKAEQLRGLERVALLR